MRVQKGVYGCRINAHDGVLLQRRSAVGRVMPHRDHVAVPGGLVDFNLGPDEPAVIAIARLQQEPAMEAERARAMARQ